MKNKNLVLVILVSLFILTNIISVKAEDVSSECYSLLSVLTSSDGSKCGDTGYEGYDKRADFNNDKKIDSEDQALLSANYNVESWCKNQMEKTFDPCDIPSNIGVSSTNLLAILTESYRTQCGDTKYNKIADIDNSKTIDFDDLGIFALHAEDESWCNAQLQKTFDPCISTTKCVDTDDGEDYYTKGQVVNSNNQAYTDSCSDSRTLKEYFCGEDGTVQTKVFNCPEGCFNGACDVGCIDRDGGENYYIKGSITGFNSDYPESLKAVDTCYNSNTLKEHFCEKLNGVIDGTIQTKYINCQNGCSDGACIADCTDTDNGRNYYLKGTLTYGGIAREDICIVEEVQGDHSVLLRAETCEGDNCFINEYACGGTSFRKYNDFNCPNGCSNGACSCDIRDTLAEGKSKTYTIHGIDYDVNAIVITDIYPYKVKFKVNGETTDAMQVGDRFKLADGAEIAVTKLNPAETTPDYVTFCLNGKQSEIEPMFENYPDFLIKDNKLNAITVIGNGAPAVDSIAATDILLGLRYYSDGQTMHTIDIPAAVLSSEVSNPRAQNMILVGRPTKYAGSESNPLIDDFSLPSLGYGNGLLKIADNGDYVAVIVTARDEEGIIKVAQYLKNYNDHTAILKGTEVRINYETSEPKCEDSDNGKNYYVKGYVSSPLHGQGNPVFDGCYSGENPNGGPVVEEGLLLGEAYCMENGDLGIDIIKCPNGCKDGACKATTSFPNLIVSKLSVYRIDSSIVGIDYCIKNTGNVDTGNFDLKFYNLDNPSWDFGGGDFGFLSANQEWCGKSTRTGVGSNGGNGYVQGNNRIKLVVDVNSEVKESNENDNELTNTFNTAISTPCTDSDGPRNFYTKGKTYGRFMGETKEWIDYCVNDNTVYDFSCKDDGISVWADSFKCPKGCKDGACIKEECIGEGETGNFGDVCCEGLKNVGNWAPMPNGECTMYRNPSFKCTNCGDGKCGLGEDYCNCREDCTVPGIPDYVDVHIEPKIRTINYGQYATYKITIKDKHPMPTGYNVTISKYTYRITVNNLPFMKEYTKQVTLPAGGKTSFTLTVKPYQLAAIEEEEVATAAKVQKITANVVVGTGVTGRVIDEMIVEENPQLIHSYYAKRYKFNVKATLSGNSGVYDRDYAELIIKPEFFIDPPDFPTEEVTIKLYKGWNLISLPGKLVQFSDNGCTINRKLLGFVYIKEQQKYVTLQQAQTILGDNFAEYLAKNAFWIYSYENCNLRARLDMKVSYSGINLYEGWNLVPITEDMVGGYLSDMASECNLEKIYKWNPQIQNWKKITKDYIFSSAETYYGFITKVTNNCVLGGVNILELSEIDEEVE